MGCNFDTLKIGNANSDARLLELFQNYQQECCIEYGSGAYAGHIGIADGLIIDRSVQFDNTGAAWDYIDENSVKWEAALAVRVLEPGKKEYWLIGAQCAS